jgi:signal transduction histidine kinase
MIFKPHSLKNLFQPEARGGWRFLRVGRVAMLAAGIVLGVFSLAHGAEVGFEMRDEGRAFQIQAPGLELGKMHFGALIQIDGINHRLDSLAGQPVGTEILADQPGPYGKTRATISTVRFENLKIDLLLKIERIEGTPCLLINAGIRNRSDRKISLGQLMMIDLPKANTSDAGASWAGQGSLQDWVLTGQHDDYRITRTFADLLKDNKIIEQFGVYRKDGAGFFLGPVGEPVAYIHAYVGSNTLFVASEMTHVVLPPGTLRWGQQIALLFEPPRQAMLRWVDWVVKTHGARTALGALDGWMDIFSEFRSSEKDLFAAIDFVRASRGRLRPQAIVLDSSLESLGQTPEEIAKQLPRFIERISAIQSTPGIRLFLNDNLNPPEENLRAIRAAADKGFRLLKLIYDFAEAKPDGQNLTLFERQRKQFEAIRSAAGESTYLLACMNRFKRAALGFIDACRSGPNASTRGLRSAIEPAIWSFPLNGRWFAVDSDTAYLATELRDVSPLVGGWPMARTWLSMVGLSCGASFTSDHWFQEKFQPYLRNFEILQPPAREETEILDLGTSPEWPRLVGKVVRPWGSWVVALLWNPGTSERNVSLDFSEIGGRPGSRYAVWSFWDNAYLGLAEGAYSTRFLAASASEHLVLTELPPDSMKPVLIGSNFHIYCGAAELKNVTALDFGMAIEFTDAGALSGSLFVYSTIQPALASATGCHVTGIESAGENVWRINIRDRRIGESQKVELSLPVSHPLHRQTWFWILSGLLMVSAGFGIRKYYDWLASSRALEQSRALHEERARIARDLHDELGASLAHTCMLGDRIEHAGEAHGGIIQRIQQNSRESLRRLDEIVWAANPERDSAEHLAAYLSKFAQEFLANSGIRLRIEIPDELPHCHLDSKHRHNLYLATREAFHNAVRHGSPASMLMRISIDAGVLVVAVEDDGCGFDPATPRDFGHGLANIHTRIEGIGGRVSISSHPGKGCAISFTIPLHTKPPP